ncbi:MAG: hypothetical protein ACLTBV_07960 [Enterocloster bolteae]
MVVFLLSGVLISVSVGEICQGAGQREKLTSDSAGPLPHVVESFLYRTFKSGWSSPAQEALVIDFMHELRGSQRAGAAPRYDEVMEAMAVRRALDPSTILGVWLADTDSSLAFSAGRLYQ